MTEEDDVVLLWVAQYSVVMLHPSNKATFLCEPTRGFFYKRSEHFICKERNKSAILFFPFFVCLFLFSITMSHQVKKTAHPAPAFMYFWTGFCSARKQQKPSFFFKWKQCNTLCIKIPNPGTQITQPERTRGCNKTATLSWWAVQNRSSSCQTWTPNSEALLWLWPAALVMSHLGRIVQRALLHPHRHYLLSSLLASSQTAKHSLSVQKTPS